MGKTDLSHYHGRTALDCQMLEIYRKARIPIGIDTSHMLALVNGIPIAKIAPTEEEGEQLWTSSLPSTTCKRCISELVSSGPVSQAIHLLYPKTPCLTAGKPY